MLRFHKKYFVLTILFFLIELLIALYIRDGFIRPYAGDFLVVILLYCFFKTFLNASVRAIALSVLLFAYAIETAQYYQLVYRLGFQNHRVLRIVIGTSFEWSDIVAYTLGIISVLFVEKQRAVTASDSRS